MRALDRFEENWFFDLVHVSVVKDAKKLPNIYLLVSANDIKKLYQFYRS